MRKDNKEYDYFCIIHYYNPSKKEYKILELKDNSNNIRRPENKKLNQENWYGAYYYDIIYLNSRSLKDYIGEDFIDSNENGKWDQGENYKDSDKMIKEHVQMKKMLCDF